MAKDNPIMVFVYGTLKRGYGNHIRLREALFCGEVATVTPYAMVSVGFPVLLDAKKYHRSVKGELYRVDNRTLADLDNLEREGEMYNRVRGKVTSQNGITADAQYYVGAPKFWNSRQLDRALGLKLYGTKDGKLEWKRDAG